MDQNDTEGSVVFEKLAQIDKVEEFLDAVDSDDAKKARSLMKAAKLDPELIDAVLEQINEEASE